MSAQSGEVPAEAIPPEETVARFKLDGLMHAVQRLTLKAQEVIDTAMKSVQRAMSSLAESGPKDYDRIADLERRMHRVEHRPSPQPINNGNGTSKAMTAALWSLAVAGVCGLVVMFGKLSAIEANQVSQQRQLDKQSDDIAMLLRRP